MYQTKEKVLAIVISVLMIAFLLPAKLIQADPEESNKLESSIEDTTEEQTPKEANVEEEQKEKVEPEETEEVSNENTEEPEGDFTYADEAKTILNGITETGLEKYGNSTLIIPDTVVRIEDNALRGETFTEVYLGRNTVELGNYSLFNTGIRSISGLENIVIVGDYALAKNNLGEVRFGGSLKDLGKGALSDNSLTQIDLNNSPNYKEIREETFSNNNITNLYLDYITIIRANAFRGNKVRELSLNADAENVEFDAFVGNGDYVIIHTESQNIIPIDYSDGFGHKIYEKEPEDKKEEPKLDISPEKQPEQQRLGEDIGGGFTVNDFEYGKVFDEDTQRWVTGITGYNGGYKLGANNGVLYIPTTDNYGNPVNTIGMGAFEGLNIIEVHIPEGIEVIQAGAFSNNKIRVFDAPHVREFRSGKLWDIDDYRKKYMGMGVLENNELVTLTLDSLERISIKEGAFRGNVNLTTVNMPNLKYAPTSYMFTGCMELRTVNTGLLAMTTEDKYINNFAYEHRGVWHTLPELKEIVVGAQASDINPRYISDREPRQGRPKIKIKPDSGGKFASADLVRESYNYVLDVIENDINVGGNWYVSDFTYREEGSYAIITGFSDRGRSKAMTENDLHLSTASDKGTQVKVVWENAFKDKTNNIKNLYIPDTITRIGRGAFAGNDNLIKVVANGVGKEGGTSALGEGVFLGNINLTRIDMGNLKGVPSSVCSGCNNLVEFNAPNATILAPNSLENIPKIKEYNFPKVTLMGADIFKGNNSLEKVTFADNFKTVGGIDLDILFKVGYEDNEKKILVYTTNNTNPNNYPVEGNNYILGIAILDEPLGNNWMTSDFTFEEISDQEYGGVYITGFSEQGLVKLATNKDLTLPRKNLRGKTVKGVGPNAFNNKGLTSIEVPDSIEVLQSGSFSNNQLTSISANGVKVIVRNLSIPEQINTRGVFEGNRQLVRVELNSLEKIKSDRNFNFTNLETIELNSLVELDGNGNFIAMQKLKHFKSSLMKLKGLRNFSVSVHQIPNTLDVPKILDTFEVSDNIEPFNPNAISKDGIPDGTKIQITTKPTGKVKNSSVVMEDYNYKIVEKTLDETEFRKIAKGPRWDDVNNKAYMYDVKSDKEGEIIWDIEVYVHPHQDNINISEKITDPRVYLDAIIMPEEFVGTNVMVRYFDIGGRKRYTFNVDKPGRYEMREREKLKITEVNFNIYPPEELWGKKISFQVVTKLKDPSAQLLNSAEVQPIRNEATMSHILGSGESSIGNKSKGFVEIRDARMEVKSKSSFDKQPGETLKSGEEFSYNVGYTKNSEILDATLIGIEYYTILPNGVFLQKVELTDEFKRMKNYNYEVIHNHRGRGETAIKFTADESDFNEDTNFAKIHAIVDPTTSLALIPIENFLHIDNNNVRIFQAQPAWNIGGYKLYHIDILKIGVTKGTGIDLKLYIRRSSDNLWTTEGIETFPGEEFEYRLVISNNSGRGLTNAELIDILPYLNDVDIQIGEDGTRKPRGTEFYNDLDVGKNISSSRNLTIGITNDNLTQRYKNNIPAEDLSSFGQGIWWRPILWKSPRTTGVRFSTGVLEIRNGETLEAIIPMKAPNDRDGLLTGKRAYNSFIARENKSGSKFVESNKVYNEMVTPHATIKLTKVNETGTTNLEGAEFEIYTKEGKFVDKAISNQAGIVVFDKLKIDDYSVREVKAPPGYTKSNLEYGVTRQELENATNHVVDLGKIKNSKAFKPIEEITGAITFRKVIKNGTPVSGVTFMVQGVSPGVNDHIKRTFITHLNGYVEFYGLPGGRYTLTEIKPRGIFDPIDPITDLVINQQDRFIQLPDVENDKVTITVTPLGVLKDKEGIPHSGLSLSDGETLGAGIEVKVTKGTQPPEIMRTDANGNIVLSGIPSDMTVRVEQLTTLDGFQISETPIEFHYDVFKDSIVLTEGSFAGIVEIGTNPVFLKNIAEDNSSILNIHIQSRDDNNYKENLKGAEFEVYKQVNPDTDEWELVRRGITDDNGLMSTKGIKEGVYKVIQTKTPKGYMRDGEKPFEREFRVTSSESRTYKFEVENAILKPKIYKISYLRKGLSLKDAQTYKGKNPGSKIERVTSKRYNVYEEVEGAVFQIKSQNEVIETLTTDSYGEAVTTVALDEMGSYYIQEIGVPEGYILNTEPTLMDIGNRKKATNVFDAFTFKIENERIAGKVQITKYKGDTEETLAGVEFTLYKDDVEVMKGTTSEAGELEFINLDFGTYTVKETRTVFGFKLNPTNAKTFTLNENNMLQKLEFRNEETDFVTLPDTGGMGPIVGLILIMFLLPLVVIKRKRKQRQLI